MLNPQLTDKGSEVLLEWTPDSACQGYRLYVDGVAVSRTFKPNAKSTTFSKPDEESHRYGIQKMDVVDELEEVAWPAPPAGGLRWPAPVLSNPVARDWSSSSHTYTGGAGRDLYVTGRQKVTGGADDYCRVQGWRNVVMTGIQADMDNVMTDLIVLGDVGGSLIGIFHLEDFDLRGDGMNDTVISRINTPIVQLQNGRIEVHTQSGSHADAFQTQVCAIDEFRMDSVTIFTDYQGLFFNNEPEANFAPTPDWRTRVDSVKLSRILFCPRNGVMPSGPWLTKAFTFDGKAIPGEITDNPLGPWEIGEDVWIPDDYPGNRLMPSVAFKDPWGRAAKRGAFIETDAQGKYVRFSTPADRVPTGAYAGQPCEDAGITGKIRVYPVGQPPALPWVRL